MSAEFPLVKKQFCSDCLTSVCQPLHACLLRENRTEIRATALGSSLGPIICSGYQIYYYQKIKKSFSWLEMVPLRNILGKILDLFDFVDNVHL